MRIIRKYKNFIFWVYCYRDIFVIYFINSVIARALARGNPTKRSTSF